MTTKERTPRFKSYGLVRSTLLAGVVAFLVWRIVTGWPAIRAVEVRWNVADLLGSALAAAAAFESLFVGWLILLVRTGVYQRRYLQTYRRIWWLTYLCRYVPGKVLVVVERARMSHSIEITPAAGVAFVVIESLIALFAAAFVAPLALMLHAGGEPGGTSVIIVALVSVAALFALPAGFRYVVGLARFRRHVPELASFQVRGSDVLASLPAFVCHYLLLGLSLFLLARGVHPFRWGDLPGLCGAYSLAQATGLITMLAPAALGVRESVLGVELSHAVPAGLAEAVAIGMRLWLTVVELLCLGLALVMTRKGRSSEAVHSASPDAYESGESTPG